LIGSRNWRQVLVFTRTKHGANRLTKQLEHDGISAEAIHGNKSQGARTRSLAGFKQGNVRVLVATDLASRGLDIDQLPHVVNFELPTVSEEYVHRIGRTGRADRQGTAVSLVCIDEQGLLKDIERLLRYSIPEEVIPGYEPDPSVEAEPIFGGRNHSKQRQERHYQPRKASDSAHGPKRVAGRKHAAGKASSGDPEGADPRSTPRDISRKNSVRSRFTVRSRNTDL